MKNLNDPEVMGKKIYKLIEKYEIMLLQDKAFPNIINEITGQKILGSWWGHTQANSIYNGLMWLGHHRPVLTIKLLDGKVTYIHESRHLDIYSIVCQPRDWQTKKLKDDELQLLNFVLKKKEITIDDLKSIKPIKEIKKSFVNLEKNLLIYATEEHTDSGRHKKKYMSWKKSKIAHSKLNDYELAKERIENIVNSLNHKFDAHAKLPWQ